MESITCRTCKKGKPKSDFSHWKRVCKECRRIKQKEWSENNKEKHRAYTKKWRERNREKYKAYGRFWKKTPKGVLANRKLAKSYREKHPDVRAAQKHRRRAVEYSASGSYTAEEWTALCDRYGNRCISCGEVKPLTIDHVVPLSAGGTNSIDNIQPLCRRCNSSKGTKTIDYRPDF